ncbi:hypothetical protein CDG81_01875 [Actinopolyspora erythraea]|uniref:Uncharacterized protein n=2 Tax=Actinopolyspora erythraea TaxID=414996 RepID=A0A223RN08_9ACTN|nr:hypothetical protein CDG81_01875 [Actinopolyspora erythraea]
MSTMAKRDIFDDMAAFAHPLPSSPTQAPPPEGFDETVKELLEQREDYAANLRAASDAEDIDPLLAEIHKVRHQREHYDRLLRQLVAYGREFVGPRPYPLAMLASAAGLGSHSSARTFYSEKDITDVAATTGAKPQRNA